MEDGVWIDITNLDSEGNNIEVNTAAKTVTGISGSLGAISISGDVGGPGGAGGVSSVVPLFRNRI